ncbi:MAG: hypothetical protein ABIA08_01725 [bacterium]
MENEEQKQPISKSPDVPDVPDVKGIIKKGLEIYDKIKEKIEPAENGKYVVIETESEKYFIGNTRDEATGKAKDEFPDKVLFIKRIGQIEKISRHVALDHPNYAGLF